MKTYNQFINEGWTDIFRPAAKIEVLKKSGRTNVWEDETDKIGNFGNFENDPNAVEFYYNDFPVETEYLEILEDGSVKFTRLSVPYNPIDITDMDEEDIQEIEHELKVFDFNDFKEFIKWYKNK